MPQVKYTSKSINHLIDSTPNDAPYTCMVFYWGVPTTVHICPWGTDYPPQWVSADGLLYKYMAPECGTTWIEAAVR